MFIKKNSIGRPSSCQSDPFFGLRRCKSRDFVTTVMAFVSTRNPTAGASARKVCRNNDEERWKEPCFLAVFGMWRPRASTAKYSRAKNNNTSRPQAQCCVARDERPLLEPPSTNNSSSGRICQRAGEIEPSRPGSDHRCPSCLSSIPSHLQVGAVSSASRTRAAANFCLLLLDWPDPTPIALQARSSRPAASPASYVRCSSHPVRAPQPL